MIEQMDLFAARAAKAEAMARVEEHASVDWKIAAMKAVLKAAQELPRFTSDDVMDRISGEVSTHELRALGPIMSAAAKHGWIAKVDCAAVPSRRTSLHASPRTVWRSLVWVAKP